MRQSFYIAIVLFCLGCGEDNRCLKSLGDVVEQEKIVSLDFSRIYVEDRIKVTLVQDASQAGRLVLRGPENLLNSVGTEVVDGEIRLVNNNTCNFLRSFDYNLEVDVYFDELVELKVESIAEVRCRDSIHISKFEVSHNALSNINLLLSGEEVFVRSRNSASTKLHGAVRILKGSIEEVSDLDAKDLECEEALLDTHTPLDCSINATRGYFLNIYNTGNIEQYGDAKVYTIINDQTSTGVVVQK